MKHTLPKKILLPKKMMGITQDVSIFWHDRNNAGGGVALIINKTFMPEEIVLNCDCEILAVKISQPTKTTYHICIQTTINTYI